MLDRLAADHDFNSKILAGLLVRVGGLEIVPLREVGLEPAPDPEVLEWTERQDRVLLSHDVNTMPRHVYERLRRGSSIPGVVIVPQHLSVRVLAAFRAWLAEPRERPSFAFVHLWDVHFDFRPPPPYDMFFDPGYEGTVTGEDFFFDPAIHAGMPRRDLDHLVALYDGEIAWTDEHVGRLLAAVGEAGDLDRTVVAVTSDHGTEFFEHGFKGHRTTLYDELIRVPLVLRYPPGLPAGVRVAEQTRALDVGPTLLELAGVPPPEGGPGHSLAHLARGGALDFDSAAVSELFSVGHRLRTLRTREWKFYDDLALARRASTDLGSDPGELELRPADFGEGPRLEARYLEAPPPSRSSGIAWPSPSPARPCRTRCAANSRPWDT